MKLKILEEIIQNKNKKSDNIFFSIIIIIKTPFCNRNLLCYYHQHFTFDVYVKIVINVKNAH